MNEKRLEEIKTFIDDNFDTPKLSPYLQVIVVEIEEFLDSEEFSDLSVVAVNQYFLLYQIMSLSVGFLRYKHADKNKVSAVLGEIIDALRLQLKREDQS